MNDKVKTIKSKANELFENGCKWVGDHKLEIGCVALCVHTLVVYCKSFDYGYDRGKCKGEATGLVKGWNMAADHYIGIINRYTMPDDMIRDAEAGKIPGLLWKSDEA